MRRVRGTSRNMLVGIVVALSLASSACGGGSEAEESKTENAAQTGADGGSAGGTDGGTGDTGQGGGDGSAPSAGSTGSTGKSTPSTAASSGSGAKTSQSGGNDDDPEAGLFPLPATVQLRETCVPPGGKQTITIRTEPKSAAGYDSVYSDGKSGIMEGFYGGNNGGYADDKGVYTDTWVVGANAPAGKVTVRVMAGQQGFRHFEGETSFTVGDALGRC